jgi:uncharacterized membrane protein YvbJ
MRKIIHKVRQQPEEVRRHILHVITIIFGIILLALWVYSLGTTFSNPEKQAEIRDGLQPISALKDQLIDGYNSLSE